MLRIYFLLNEGKADGIWGVRTKVMLFWKSESVKTKKVPLSERLLHVIWLNVTLFLNAIFHLLYHLLTKCIKLNTYVSPTAICFE